MNNTFDVVAIKREIDAGRIDVNDVVKTIDEKIRDLNADIYMAKELVEEARETKGDFFGKFGSEGRVKALANALSKTNETISETNELIRGVIGLVLCSTAFSLGLIRSATELSKGEIKDANGRIIKLSNETTAFIRSVIEIANGVTTTQMELRREIKETKHEIRATQNDLEENLNLKMDQMLFGFKKIEDTLAQKANKILEEAREIVKNQDLAIGVNKDAIKKADAKNAEQDRLLEENAKVDEVQNAELKRQAEKDEEHDHKIAENAKGITEQGKALEEVRVAHAKFADEFRKADNEQDAKIERQAQKNVELEKKTEANKTRITSNAKEIEKNARMISGLENRLKIQRRSIAQAKLKLGTGKASIIISIVALVSALAAVALVLWK